MLKDISVRVYKNEKRPSFQFYTGGVEQLYKQYLGKKRLNSTEIINLYFTNQEYQILNNYTSILNVNLPFDFNAFEEKESNFEKKLLILNTLHVGFKRLAEDLGWNTIYFETSYNKCLENHLSYNWLFKNKLFRSPDRNYYFGLWHQVDVGEYNIWQILFDKNKIELTRRLCFKDNVCVFYIDYASWEGQSERFYYQFNGPKKKFVAQLEEIKLNMPIQIHKDSNSFFNN